jgi:hypothetical protein
VQWIHLAWDADQRRAHVNTVKKRCKFPESLFALGRCVFHGDSYLLARPVYLSVEVLT